MLYAGGNMAMADNNVFVWVLAEKVVLALTMFRAEEVKRPFFSKNSLLFLR